jgi:hypothetical protein
MTPAPPLPPPVRAALVVGMTRIALPPAGSRCARAGPFVSCVGAVGTLRMRTPDGRVVRFARPPSEPMFWRAVARSPDQRWLLLGANMPCDSTGAFVVTAAGGRPAFVPKLLQGCDESVSWPLGWTREGRALVAVDPIPRCGCRLRAGVYAVDPKTRRGRLLWRGSVRGFFQRR